jgi:flagellar FliL protein
MAEASATDEQKKSPKKMIMIIAIIVVLLIAGGGGYYFMTQSADAEQSEHGDKDKKGKGKDKHAKDEHKAKEEHKDEHKADDEHGEAAEPEVYHNLTPALVVNCPDGTSAKVIKISLTILLKGEASIAALKKHDPMLRNNLLMVIGNVGPDKARTVEGKKELRALLLAEIGSVLEKMAGKNTVKDVYFTEFVMQ